MAVSEEAPRGHDPGSTSGLPTLLSRALRARRARALLAVIGIATGVLLVLVLFATMRSPWVSVSAYLAQRNVDLWVMPSGTDNLVRTAGFLPMAVALDLAEMPDVARADPVVRVFVRASPWRARQRASDQSLMLLAMGYRVHGGLGGPPRFDSGRAPEGEFEVAIDRAAAHRLGIGVGDSLNVNGRVARISGITRDTNLLITQFLFFDFDVVARVSGLEDQTSFVVVQARSGRAGVVESAIREAFPGVLVLPREVFERNSLREAASGFLPVLTLITVLGVISGAVLIALLVQGVVEDRRADIAVLLAMGTGLVRIGIAVIVHAALLVAVGSALGFALSVALGAAFDAFQPTVQLAFLPADIALVWIAFAVAGVAGAMVPVWRMRRIDPAEAFRS